ncbi:hypothetical protein Tco_1245503 [Tanacetum coccineum]
MAFDLRPTEDVLPWPGNANMAFDLRPTEDVLPSPGNANMAFDLWPTEDVIVAGLERRFHGLPEFDGEVKCRKPRLRSHARRRGAGGDVDDDDAGGCGGEAPL